MYNGSSSSRRPKHSAESSPGSWCRAHSRPRGLLHHAGVCVADARWLLVGCVASDSTQPCLHEALVITQIPASEFQILNVPSVPLHNHKHDMPLTCQTKQAHSSAASCACLHCRSDMGFACCTVLPACSPLWCQPCSWRRMRWKQRCGRCWQQHARTSTTYTAWWLLGLHNQVAQPTWWVPAVSIVGRRPLPSHCRRCSDLGGEEGIKERDGSPCPAQVLHVMH